MARPPDPDRPPAHPAPHSDPDFMLSLARGLSVMRAFGQGKPRQSIREIAVTTGLSRAAVRRCLHTLRVLGYADGDGGVYELTPATLALASTYLGSTLLARAAQPILERLAAQTQEATAASVLDGDDILFVARASVRARILSIEVAVGGRLPAVATAMGRVLIANLDEPGRNRFIGRVKLVRHTPRTIVDKAELRAELSRVRSQGYAVIDQELELGLRSLGVPVAGPAGRVVSAICTVMHAARADRQTLVREFLPALQQAAVDIAAATHLA